MDIRLRSLARQVVDVEALDMQVAFDRGEEMRTEISTKFARQGLEGIYARVRPRDGRLVDRPGRAVRALSPPAPDGPGGWPPAFIAA